MVDPEPSTLPKNWWTRSDCKHPNIWIFPFARLSSIPSHMRCIACKCCLSVGWLTVSFFSPVPIHQVACKVTANYTTNNLPSTPACSVLCSIPFASCKIKCETCMKILLETILIFLCFCFPRHVSVLKHLQEVKKTKQTKTFAVRDVFCWAPSWNHTDIVTSRVSALPVCVSLVSSSHFLQRYAQIYQCCCSTIYFLVLTKLIFVLWHGLVWVDCV